MTQESHGRAFGSAGLVLHTDTSALSARLSSTLPSLPCQRLKLETDRESFAALQVSASKVQSADERRLQNTFTASPNARFAHFRSKYCPEGLQFW